MPLGEEARGLRGAATGTCAAGGDMLLTVPRLFRGKVSDNHDPDAIRGFEAFRSIDVPEDKALKAAAALSKRDDDVTSCVVN